MDGTNDIFGMNNNNNSNNNITHLIETREKIDSSRVGTAFNTS